MEEEQKFYTIILRHDSSTQWMINNPVLALGEYAVEDDTHRVKRGDGLTVWAALPYEEFGLQYMITYENLKGDPTDNEKLSEAFFTKVDKAIFDDVNSNVVSGINLTYGDESICTITRINKDVNSSITTTDKLIIKSPDNSIQGFWSIDEFGVKTLKLTAESTIDDYVPGMKYNIGHIIYHDSKLYRANASFMAPDEFDPEYWDPISSMDSDDIAYDSRISGLTAKTVEKAIDELAGLDSDKVVKTRRPYRVYGTNEDGDQYLYDKDELRTVDTVNGVEADEHKNIQIDAKQINYDDSDLEPKTIKQAIDLKVDKNVAGSGNKIVRQADIGYDEEDGALVLTQTLMSLEDGSVEQKVQEINVGSDAEIQKVKEELNERIDEEVETLNTTIATTETIINTRIDNEVQTINDRVDTEVATLNKTIDNAVETLDTKIDENDQAINTKVDDLATELRTADQTLQTNIDTLDTKVETYKSELDTTIADNKTDIENKLTTAETTINERIDTEVETLNTTIADNKTDIEGKLAEAESTINNRIDTEVQTLNTTITTKETTINNRIDTEVETLNQTIDTLEDKVDANKSELDTTIAELTQTVADNKEDIEGKLDTAEATINTRIDTEVETLNDRIDDEVADLNVTIEGNYNTLDAKIDETAQTAQDNLEAGLDLKVDKSLTDKLVTEVEVATESGSKINEPTLKITSKNPNTTSTTIHHLHFKEAGSLEITAQNDHILFDVTVLDNLVAGNSAKINQHTTQIASVRDDVNNLITHDAQQDTQLANHSTQIAAVQVESAAVQTRMTIAETEITGIKTTNAEQEAHLTSLDQITAENANNIQVNADAIIATNRNVSKNAEDIDDLKDNKADKVFATATDDMVVGKLEKKNISNGTILELQQTNVSPVDGSTTSQTIKIISSDNTVVATQQPDGTIDIATNLDTDVNYFMTSETLSDTIAAETIIPLNTLTPTDKLTPEIQDIVTDEDGTWARIKEISDVNQTVTVVTFSKRAQGVWGQIKGDITNQQDLQRQFTTLETDLTTALNTAKNELNTAITNEATARTTADNTLQDNIDAEELARQNADTALDTAKVDKVSGANQIYGTDSNGNQTSYNKDSFGKVDTVNNVTPDANKNVTIVAGDINTSRNNTIQQELDGSINNVNISSSGIDDVNYMLDIQTATNDNTINEYYIGGSDTDISFNQLIDSRYTAKVNTENVDVDTTDTELEETKLGAIIRELSTKLTTLQTAFEAEVKVLPYTQGTLYRANDFVYIDYTDIMYMSRVRRDYQSDITKSTILDSFIQDIEDNKLMRVGIPAEIVKDPTEYWQKAFDIYVHDNDQLQTPVKYSVYAADIESTSLEQEVKVMFNNTSNNQTYIVEPTGLESFTLEPREEKRVMIDNTTLATLNSTNWCIANKPTYQTSTVRIQFVDLNDDPVNIAETVTASSLKWADDESVVYSPSTGVGNEQVFDNIQTGRDYIYNSTHSEYEITQSSITVLDTSTDQTYHVLVTSKEPADASEAYNILNEVLGDTDEYEGMGGTEEEVESVLDEIIGEETPTPTLNIAVGHTYRFTPKENVTPTEIQLPNSEQISLSLDNIKVEYPNASSANIFMLPNDYNYREITYQINMHNEDMDEDYPIVAYTYAYEGSGAASEAQEEGYWDGPAWYDYYNTVKDTPKVFVSTILGITSEDNINLSEDALKILNTYFDIEEVHEEYEEKEVSFDGAAGLTCTDGKTRYYPGEDKLIFEVTITNNTPEDIDIPEGKLEGGQYGGAINCLEFNTKERFNPDDSEVVTAICLKNADGYIYLNTSEGNINCSSYLEAFNRVTNIYLYEYIA